MRAAGVVAAIAVALALQTTLAGIVSEAIAVDLVLVVVVYVALTTGPVPGLLTGAFGGLAQDTLSGGLVGIGGLAKTIVGFIAGVVGAQLIVTQPIPRFLVFFAASLVNAGVFVALYGVLTPRGLEAPLMTTVGWAVGNGLVGLLAFQAIELLPGLWSGRRERWRR